MENMQIKAVLDASYETLSRIHGLKEHLNRCYRQKLYAVDDYVALLRSVQATEDMTRYHIQVHEHRYERIGGKFEIKESKKPRFEIKSIDSID